MELLTNTQKNINKAGLAQSKQHGAVTMLMEDNKFRYAVDLMTRNTVDYFINDLGYAPSEVKPYDIEKSIMFDAVKAVVNYLLPTDSIEVLTTMNNGGTVSINAVVTRDGDKFGFDTESILAGGAVQQLHRRYIVKTGLHKLNKGAEDMVKRLTKAERLREDIAIARKNFTFQEEQYYIALMGGDTHGIKMYEIRMNEAQKNIDKAITKMKLFIEGN